MNSPMPVPWNTKLPAVDNTPPFHGAPSSARHTSLRATGSQAARCPLRPLLIFAFIFGSCGKDPELKSIPVFHASACCLALFSGKKGNPASVTGTYTNFVTGLNDMGCQLCAPPGPGIAKKGLPVSL